MIQIDNSIAPSKEVLEQLKNWQSEIAGTFEQKKDLAKNLFSNRNKKGNKTFDAVKTSLAILCSGARRCVYCEDSLADEVEHIYPKDLYPDKTFIWENYVYACGPCNGPKNNKFAIFIDDTEDFLIVNPPNTKTPSVEPPKGSAVLINPRAENPLDFCVLDLKDTFKFVSIHSRDTKVYRRFDYTYNDVLSINIGSEGENLCDARREAFGDYRARLVEYDKQKSEGQSQETLDKLFTALKKKNHPTVFKEIQRYHREGWLIRIAPELDEILTRNPEIATW